MAKGKQNKCVSRIRYIGFEPQDEQPDLAVYAIDRNRQTLKVSEVDKKGEFSLPDSAVEKAHRIVIGPKVDDVSTLDRKILVSYRPSQFKTILETTGRFEIPKLKWYPWLTVRRCVSGSVSHCHWHPWLADSFTSAAQFNAQLLSTAQPELSKSFALKDASRTISDATIARPALTSIFGQHCTDVCEGVVEVYRRNCCCEPWIIYDPRLNDLLVELEKIRDIFPPDLWPPRLQPDPAPFEQVPYLKGATLNEAQLSAGQDLVALRSLPAESIPGYINVRPYLHCHCGSATKVASGFIKPDGEFSICWYDSRRFTLINCHDEYAYVVKQNIDGDTVTIYDGLAANKWFHTNSNANLVSYHPRAQSCRNNDFEGEGAFALLQDIGYTGSFHLKTPDATAWDRVANLGYNDGLAFPAANAAAAKGKYLDRNWGGTLPLRYHFSEAMKGIGAKYYRVSVIEANHHGSPVGDRTYLAPTQWRYYEYVGNEIHVHQASLGPHNAGGQFNLYEIPYDADREWQDGLYHAMLDTTQHTEGRYLLMVEVFNAAGQLLRPTGTSNPGGSTEADFTYRRWYQEIGPTAEVPYAALTHVLWWDNNKAVAKIEDLRVNSAPNTAECQFLVSSGGSQFSVGYRAYHPQPMFMLDHRVWWRRGLGGPNGTLTSPNPNPDNVGAPPSPPHQSGDNSFATMLAGLSNPKCSFSVNVYTNVKTFNGTGTLNGYDDWDQAAFALEMTS